MTETRALLWLAAAVWAVLVVGLGVAWVMAHMAAADDFDAATEQACALTAPDRPLTDAEYAAWLGIIQGATR